MKQSRWLAAALLIPLFAEPTPVSFIVLNTQSSRLGVIPDGWQVKRGHGRPEISIVKAEDGPVVRMRSNKASFGLERGVDVDPLETPYLVWKWKVTQLPPGGDFRKSSTDDQAAQILVAFSDRRIITYIWDSSAPKETMASASSIPLVRITAVVCRSGAIDLNRWLQENRNVAQDYERAFNRKAPKVKGIRLQINSQHTSSSAESFFSDVAFRSKPV